VYAALRQLWGVAPLLLRACGERMPARWRRGALGRHVLGCGVAACEVAVGGWRALVGWLTSAGRRRGWAEGRARYEARLQGKVGGRKAWGRGARGRDAKAGRRGREMSDKISDVSEAEEAQAREAWRRRHERDSAVPCAQAFDVQARTHRDRYDGMARPASRDESVALLAQLAQLSQLSQPPQLSQLPAVASGEETKGAKGAALLGLFAESRSRPLKTGCALPQRWAQRGTARELRAEARPGEFFVWQVGLWVARGQRVRVLRCSLPSVRWSKVAGATGQRGGRTYPLEMAATAEAANASLPAPPRVSCLSLGGRGGQGERPVPMHMHVHSMHIPRRGPRIPVHSINRAFI
jgi:hypothetical protein